MIDKLQIHMLFILLFSVNVFANIQIGTPDNLTECFQSPTEGFDLTLNDANVLDGLSPDLYTVYYFDNQADSNNNQITNAISDPTNYSAGSFGLGQVWVNVVENADETNFDNSTFLLISNQQPFANTPENANLNSFNAPNLYFIGIDDINDNSYDLTLIDNFIIGGQGGNLSISYFENQADAVANVNPIQNPESFFIDPADGIQHIINISARIEFTNSEECFDTVNFDIYVFNPSENEFNVEDKIVCVNPNGQSTINLEDEVLLDIDDIVFGFVPAFIEIDENGNTIGIFENPINGFDPVFIEVRYRLNYNGTIVNSDGNNPFNIINQFTIFLNPTPQVQEIQNVLGCSAGDGETTFDLTINDSLALGDQEGNYNISYHFTLQEANAGINSVTDLGLDPTQFTLDNVQQFLFLRIENVDEPSCFSVDFFTLQETDSFVAFAPEDTTFCSSSGENSITIDLTQFDEDVKGNQNINGLTVAYFDEDNVLIENPESFLVEDLETTITANISLSSQEDCSDEIEFDIILNQTPEIQNLNDLQVCSDFDFTSTFDLTENIPEAIGTQNETQIEVSFFTSLADAENNENSLAEQEIDATEYPVFAEMETIFIRLQNQDATDCFVVDSFEVQSFPTEINEVGDLVECTEEGVSSAIFDLTQIETNLFPDEADTSDFSIAYFDENDDEITNVEACEITSAESILVEITNLNNSDCVASTTFNLSLNVTPEIQNLNDLQVCSGFDFTATFDLTENISEAIGTQDETEIEVSFFTSLADAENNENSLAEQEIDATEYPVFTEMETIFIRLQNQDATDCFVVDSFELQSFPTEINEVGDLVECTEEGVSSAIFDLTQIESDLFPDEADTSNFSIAYFDENDDEITNVEAYEITSAESILVEITNLNNSDCVASTTFNLSLNVTPEIQNLNNLQVCSDFEFTSTFDLTENIPEAIGAQDETEIEVSFFTSLENAENNENSLAEQEVDATEYTVFSETETIYIRLQNQDATNCFVVDSFDLQSFPTEINEVGDLVECTEEGVSSAIFDLTQIETDLFPDDADAYNFEIAYFDENDDEITNVEAYEITSAESILVEITNLNNSDCVASTTFNLSLNITPEIQNLNNLQVCSDFDFTSTFDLTENIPEAIGTQDETEIEVSFFTSLADAENNENSLAEQEIDVTEYPVFAEIETIFIRLQNQDATNCFVVDSFELLSFPIEINGVGDLEECFDPESQSAFFNLEEIVDELLGDNQSLENYQVIFFNQTGSEILATDNYEISLSELITAEVFNLNNTNCSLSQEINLVVLDEDDPECSLRVQDEVFSGLSIYPNPTSGRVFIENKLPIQRIEILDIQGKLIKSIQGDDIHEIQLNGYAGGMYFLRISKNNVQHLEKIIKN